MEKSYELLRKGGSLLVFNDFKKASEIIGIAAGLGFEYKDTLIWRKTNPMPRNRDRRYAPDVEMIIWFVKPGKWTFNRQCDTYESSVISVPSESGAKFKRYHPTQKPVKLIERLIRLHSDEGELVLDPFHGLRYDGRGGRTKREKLHRLRDGKEILRRVREKAQRR